MLVSRLAAIELVSSERPIAVVRNTSVQVVEREYLLTQINRFGGNISRTASFVGMERSALHRKLKSLGLSTTNKAGARVAVLETDG